MASTDSLAVPQKGVAYRATFPIYDNTGALVTGAAGLDSEVSKDQGTFTDCTNEATEIATASGMYYLDLTSTEMNADGVAVIVKTSTSNAKTTPLVFNLGGTIPVNVTAIGGDTTSVTNLKSATNGGSYNVGGGSIVAASVTGAVGSVTGAVGSVTGAVGSVTGAVGSVTGNVGGNVTGSVGSVVGAVGSVVGAVGSVTGNVGGNVTGSIGSLATQAKADVNAEVVDTLNVDTYAEPGQENPPATTTLVKKIGYLYKLARNKVTQTATTLSIYADDTTTVDQKATVSDDGTTFTKGEIGTGP